MCLPVRRAAFLHFTVVLIQSTIALNTYNIECLGGYGPSALAASHGPGLTVTSVSPKAPTGVSVVSDNAYSGPIAVAGDVPFLGVVSIEGWLPTVGLGSVAYACGRGNIAILSENIGRVTTEPLGFVSEGLDYSVILAEILNNAGLPSSCVNGLYKYDI